MHCCHLSPAGQRLFTDDLYDSPAEDICPRPYEKEERTLQRNYIQDLLFFESESEDSGPVAKDNMEYIFDIGGHYRLRRLFHSIEGYHKVNSVRRPLLKLNVL